MFNTKSPAFIEDLITDIAWGRIKVFQNDEQVISSFETQINLGRTLTQKQGALAVKICRKYRSQLINLHGTIVDTILNNEIFKDPLRTYIPPPKTIKIVKGSGYYQRNVISVTFPYDEKLVMKLREFPKDHPSEWAQWHAEDKLWLFSLTEGSVMWLANNLLPLGFDADSQFLEFYEKIQEIMEKMEEYAPSMVVENDQPVFKNVHHSVPAPKNDKIIDALFLAKLYGIDVWDEKCENFINSDKISPITRKFLKKEIGHEMTVKAKSHDIGCFDELFESIDSVMIVIPEHQELGYLKKWYEHLISRGYTENDMTVMFRVDNITNRAFNDYVRDNKLNTPIHKDMKFVFVSRRIKKPLVKSGIDFGLVISSDPLGSHQALKKILNDKYHSIVYVDKLEDE
jgi:hypothetical protein